MVRLYDQLSPDLMFLDLHMPEPNGFEVLEQLSIRKSGQTLSTPVLVLTADVTPGAKLKALALGADDFLTKPIERFELLLRTRNLLKVRFLHRELTRESASLQEMTSRASEAEKSYHMVLERLVRTGEHPDLEALLFQHEQVR